MPSKIAPEIKLIKQRIIVYHFSIIILQRKFIKYTNSLTIIEKYTNLLSLIHILSENHSNVPSRLAGWIPKKSPISFSRGIYNRCSSNWLVCSIALRSRSIMLVVSTDTLVNFHSPDELETLLSIIRGTWRKERRRIKRKERERQRKDGLTCNKCDCFINLSLRAWAGVRNHAPVLSRC